MYSHKSIFRNPHRAGLTLIEVLSAIAVASIGVFGVLVLIPLASRMSEIGFSNQATRQTADNVIEKAASYGTFNFNRWILYNGSNWVAEFPRAGDTVGDPLFPNQFANGTPIAYCIDPLMIRSQDATGASVPVNTFPNVEAPAPSYITTNGAYDGSVIGNPTVGNAPAFRYTLAAGDTSLLVTPLLDPRPIGSGMAELMMSERNSVRLLQPVSDVSPPLQSYFRESGAAVAREMGGSKSSIALLLPMEGSGQNLIYRLMSIVISNRSFLSDSRDFYDRVFDVAVANSTLADPTVVDLDAGVVDLRLLEIQNSQVNANLPSKGWILLLPYTQVTPSDPREVDWTKCKPFQIVSSDVNGVNDFRVSVIGSPYSAVGFTGTMAIYIPNSVDVRETEVRLGVSQ